MPYKDKEARKEYMRKWSVERRRRNRKILQDYKVEQGCADCGYNAHHAGLFFDHLPEFEKKYNVAQVTQTLNLMWEEIKKCEVVCGTCHGIRTWTRLEGKLT